MIWVISMSLQHLKNRILHKGDSEINNLVYLARELHCLPEIIGGRYEVYNRKGELVYTIKHKPMSMVTLNTLMKGLNNLNKKEAKQMGGLKRR